MFRLNWFLIFLCSISSSDILLANCRQALVLALDVSGSVDENEYDLQLKGLSSALISEEVKNKILSMPELPVKILVFEWSGPEYQKVLVPWVDISTEEVLKNVASELSIKKRTIVPPTTALGTAIQTGVSLLNQQNGCWKKTLDISGDGKSNVGPEPHEVNQPNQIGDITINALIIGVDTPARLSNQEVEISELVTYFSNEVIAGLGSFSEVALGFADYERAMIKKLVRELGYLNISTLNHVIMRKKNITTQ